MNDSPDPKNKYLREVLKQLSWVGQLGLSLIMPLLICMFVCMFLCNKFNIGGWIFIPGFIMGLGAGFMTAYKFYMSETKKSSKDKDKPRVNFNRHT